MPEPLGPMIARISPRPTARLAHALDVSSGLRVEEDVGILLQEDRRDDLDEQHLDRSAPSWLSEPVARPLWVVVGVVLVLVGALWTLQGLGVLQGSPMSGATTWAIIGPIVLIVGVALTVVGTRGRKR